MPDVELKVGARPVRVLVAHFGMRARERHYQVRKLIELLGETPTSESLVVLGDMNEWLPLSRPLRSLHRLLGKSPAERLDGGWRRVRDSNPRTLAG